MHLTFTYFGTIFKSGAGSLIAMSKIQARFCSIGGATLKPETDAANCVLVSDPDLMWRKCSREKYGIRWAAYVTNHSGGSFLFAR